MNQIKMLNLFPKMFTDLHRRYYLYILIFPSLFLLIFVSFSFSISSSFLNIPPIKTLFSIPYHHKLPPITPLDSNKTELNRLKKQNLDELNRSKIAICLVGGARRFELTGSSILKNVLKIYPNSDLFLHSPLDKDSYKFSLLKNLSRIASIRIFKPKRLMETESQVRVLTSDNSPNGIQVRMLIHSLFLFLCNGTNFVIIS
ncbi:transmembrane protein [Thalictrum thalictroides]|uniref:Transmembrane protein n=1 Tax=Thalictrum thalictroides TaxID=46969 RepID=A0A7J6VJV0_THATH|nr:transmembrane protein [Thalictrum thalictroides]